MTLSVIETVEAQIVTFLQTLAYFQDAAGGSARGVTDIKTYLELNTVPSPSAIVVFDGEVAKPNMVIGRSVQQTEFRWTIYTVASSFSAASEGRLGATGSYQMTDDIVGALEGQLIVLPTNNAKLFYLGSERFGVNATQVVYASRWGNDYVRTGI